MKYTLQKAILMLVALFLVIAPVNQVFAEDEQEVPRPRIDAGDQDDNVRPGWDDSTSKSDQSHPDREFSWDEIKNESSAPGKDGAYNQEDNSTSAGDEQDVPQPSIDDRDRSDNVQPGRDDYPEQPGQSHPDRELGLDEIKNELSAPEKDDTNNGVESSIGDVTSDITGHILGILGADGETGSAERKLQTWKDVIGIPLSIFKPMMTDGQKALTDLSQYSVEVAGTGIEWYKLNRDSIKIGGNKRLLNPISKVKDAFQATSNFINTTMSKGSSLLSTIMTKGKDMTSKGSSVLSSVMSKGKDKLRGSSVLSSALSKSKEMFTKGSSAFSSVMSKGKDMLSKGSSVFSSMMSKGKDMLSKGSSAFSSVMSKGKDMLSKGSSAFSSVMSKGKDMLSKGSSAFSSVMSKGKDMLSKGSSVFSSVMSKGKDMLSKGSSVLSSAVSKGKDLFSKGTDLLSKGKAAITNSKFGTVLSVAKKVAVKGVGVLSLAGAVTDGFKAVDHFKSGKMLDGTGSTLAVVGGLLTAAALLTPVGLTVGVIGLAATGASLIIEHRKAIKEGAKKVGKAIANGAKAAKDTVVNGFKSIGKGLGSIFG